MRRALMGTGILLVVTAASSFAQIVKKSDNKNYPDADFVFDQPDVTVPTTFLSGQEINRYDPDVIERGGFGYLTWLEYEPSKGDRIFIGRVGDDEIVSPAPLLAEAGTYSRPTFTGTDQQITYEAEVDGQWDLFWHKGTGKPVRLTTAQGPDIRHRTAPDGKGGFWIVWQSGDSGVFQIQAMHVGAEGPGTPMTVAASASSQWHPDVAVNPAGEVFVVWDEYRNGSYDVLLCQHKGGAWGQPILVAAGAGFEGRAGVVCDPAGNAWILWEQGALRWGQPYAAKLDRGKVALDDTTGSLHRHRRLHLASYDGSVLRNVRPPLPMPSMKVAKIRPDRPESVYLTGTFYERGVLCVDSGGRVWVIYRHVYAPWLGCAPYHHVEGGYGVYGRYVSSDGWSKLHRFDADQGDGLQRLSIAASGHGLLSAWTTGRTDRREPVVRRGIHVARAKAAGGPAPEPGQFPTRAVVQGQPGPDPIRISHTTRIDGKAHKLYFGDLHRHTDLSLCFVPLDGTIDDAYRYAIDPGGLDFLGITDHTRDISNGQADSLLWWRCRKEVNRHHLPGAFVPMYSYERSRGETDHNVITLNPEMLRPHTYPHAEFWAEIDTDTFTIPHQPVNRVTWKSHDEVKRPLMEVYQGCRDNSVEPDVLAGLEKGYRFGLIASSDHLSTNVSFAAVYAPAGDRESIFRALQARKTYGATAKIVLEMRVGDAFMGQALTAPRIPPISVQVRGTAPIKAIRLYRGQRLRHAWAGDGTDMLIEFNEIEPLEGKVYYMVQVEQVDGHRAWGSPIWITIGKAAS